MSLENNFSNSTNNKKDILSADEIKQKIKNLKEKKVVIVNAEDLVENEARDATDIILSKEKYKAGIFGKITKTLFHSYNRVKKLNEVKEKIKTTDNIYADQDDTRQAHQNAMLAIVERFSSEYEELIEKKGGEEKKLLDNKNVEGVKTVADIKKIIIDYAKGVLNDVTFREERNRIIGGISDENIKGASTFADNLLEKAQEVKVLVEHGVKLEELDLDFEVILGKAKSSIKTEAKYNTVDKLVDKLSKTKIGKYISPATLSLAVGVGYTALAIGSKTLLRNRALALGTFGASAVVSGALMGINESKRLADERRQHAREMAKGGLIESGSKRREEMEEHSYATIDARASMDEINSLLYEVNTDGKQVLKNLSENDIRLVLAKIGDIEARKNLANEKKIDLINYSSLALAEKERTEMDIMRAKVKSELRVLTNKKFKDIFGKLDFDEYLDTLTKSTQDTLQGGAVGLDVKDKTFRKMQIKKSVWKGVKTALYGAVIGGTIQEIKALADDHVEGVIEGIFSKDHLAHGGAIIQTPLEHLRGYLTGSPTHLGGPSVMHELNDHNFRLPEGANIIENTDGTFDITLGARVIVDDVPITFNSDGTLTPESIELLGKEGIVAYPGEDLVIGGKIESNVSAEDYIKNHPGSSNTVHRDLWYDNDTPKPVFDKNELKLHWGGGQNSGIDANGNYVFNVKHMAPGGSFHDSFNVNAQDKIKNHGLKMLLSLTRGTQTHPFEVDIDANGNAIIDPDSEVGKLFFSTKDGHAVFRGRYAEVAEMMDSKDGVDNVRLLATYEGPGRETIPDVIDTTQTEKVIDLDLPLDDEPPYFIPIMYRKPLEPLVYKKFSNREKKQENLEKIDPFTYYFGGSGFQSTKDQRKKYELERSKALKENPDAILDQFREIEAYLNRQDKDYLKYLKGMADEMGPINKECRLAVCIPVAGHQEGANIYQTLNNFTSQKIDKSKFEIVLFVNRPDIDKNGNKIEPDSTMDEIRRFKNDFPDMQVRVVERVIKSKDARIGYIRKMMNDAVLLRQNDRGKDAPEFFMVSNDADNKGVAPEYIDNFISKFDNHKEVDSMIGQLDWDPASYIRNPLIHIGTRLFLYNSAQSRSKGWHFDSSGANFAFRSSIYAAVGGYSGDLPGGEDTDFGAKINASRSGAKNKKAIAYAGARVSRLYTSSRRAEMVMEKHGLSPVEQWDAGFSAFDDEVRKVNWENKGGRVDYKNKEEVEKLIASLETVINRTIKRTQSWGISTKDRNLQRSLGWMGIKYEITGEHSIKITDASKLIEDLERYQTEGLKILKRKTTEQVLTKPSNIEIKKQSREFLEMAAKDKEIMRTIKSEYNRYFAAKNYKYLNINNSDDLKLKKEIDGLYENEKKVSGHENWTMEIFLQNLVGDFDQFFAKKLVEIKEGKKDKENNSSNESNVNNKENNVNSNEQKKEIKISKSEIESEITKNLLPILKKNDADLDEPITIKSINDKFNLQVKIKKSTFLGTFRFSINAIISNENNTLKLENHFYEGDSTAISLARGKIDSQLSNITPAIYTFLENKYGKKIEKLNISGDNLTASLIS